MRERDPDRSLFFDILHTLEAIDVPYTIIGGFAGAVYGVTRVTYDIDIVVDLDDAHVDALATAYPSPRYYADPYQIRRSIKMGVMFNIIDAERGQKAVLIPLNTASEYLRAFENRVKQMVDAPGGETFSIWCAQPEDAIIGKLMAWEEGRSRKHENDIYEILVFHYLQVDRALSTAFSEHYIDEEAARLGDDVAVFWEAVKTEARTEADRQRR